MSSTRNSSAEHPLANAWSSTGGLGKSCRTGRSGVFVPASLITVLRSPFSFLSCSVGFPAQRALVALDVKLQRSTKMD